MNRSITSTFAWIIGSIAVVSFGVAIAVSGQSARYQIAALLVVLVVSLGVSVFATSFRVATTLKNEASAVQQAIEEFPDVPDRLRPSFDYVQSVWGSLETTRKRALHRAHEIERERSSLSAVLDSMQDWVLAVDARLSIEWANKPMRRALNGSIHPGSAVQKAIPDADFIECLEQSQREASVVHKRCENIMPGRIFDVITTPSISGGAVAVLHDRTRMEQVERTQREFIGNVSHELRTPLTSITGFVETVLHHEDSISQQSREFLETTLKNAMRMTRLTDDLIAMARVESGENKLDLKPHHADEIVREAMVNLHGLAANNAAVLCVGELTSAEVLADSDAMQQVLSNLVENATKYGTTPRNKTARVEVSARQLENGVEFRVRDWGEGIAPEHIGRLFERFYRIDKARSRETGGTGLGLAIVQHIVQAQGGDIRVESAPGEGSTFIFTLPFFA